MEDSRFDSLSRLLAGNHTRRRAMRLALATFIGGTTLVANDPASARTQCREGGRQCTRNGQCCTGDCMRVGTGTHPRYICRCPRGLQLCSNRCVDPESDTRSCGACGKRCKTGETCCGGACVRLGTKDHCGACGDRCAGEASCVSGTCMSVCVEGPGIDACCDNVATRLGTDTDCDDCGDSCAGFGSCYEYDRDPDGTFRGAECCDCTDKCGTFCGGNCPPCSGTKGCDPDTNTCVACLPGPTVDACCGDVATPLGTDSDCDDCGDACTAPETCYAYDRDPDGIFAGAVCCDCTDRCGSYCDGLCPDCTGTKTCDVATNTCTEPLVCAGLAAGTGGYVTTDTPPVLIAETGITANAANYYYPDGTDTIDFTGLATCLTSTDCAASCPASTVGGGATIQCNCLAAYCDNNQDDTPTSFDGSYFSAEGGVTGKYYCWVIYTQ